MARRHIKNRQKNLTRKRASQGLESMLFASRVLVRASPATTVVDEVIQNFRTHEHTCNQLMNLGSLVQRRTISSSRHTETRMDTSAANVPSGELLLFR